MLKLFKCLMALLLIAGLNSKLLAQNNIEESSQNPFSQPNFLKYTPPVIPRKKPAEKPVIIDEVIPEFSLTATFISVNSSMAVVNDTLLSIGEEIDGIRLIMVGNERVKINYKGKIVDIELQEISPDNIQKNRRNGFQ